MQANKLLGLVEEIQNTITEAGEVAVGDNVLVKDGELKGVKMTIINLHPELKSADITMGKGGIRVNMPLSNLEKVKSHPGVGA